MVLDNGMRKAYNWGERCLIKINGRKVDMSSRMIRMQIAISVETKKAMEKVSNSSGIPIGEIIRHTLNSKFNQTWIDIERQFYKKLDENISPTSGGTGGKKS